MIESRPELCEYHGPGDAVPLKQLHTLVVPYMRWACRPQECVTSGVTSASAQAAVHIRLPHALAHYPMLPDALIE